MGLAVDVVHPALARYVPKGSRKARTDMVAFRTQASLTEADPADFRLVAMFDHGTPIMEHAGRLWRKLTRWDQGLGRSVDAGPGDLAAFLGGTPRADLKTIKGAFLGTPLLAAGSGQEGTRGMPVEDLAGARMEELGGRGATYRVQDFLDRRVRVAGDKAYVRPDMIACANWNVGRYYLWLHASGSSQDVFLGHPGNPDPALEYLRGGSRGEPPALAQSLRQFRSEYKRVDFGLVPADAHVMPFLSIYARQIGDAATDRIESRDISAAARRTLRSVVDDNPDLWFDAATNQVGPESLARLHALKDTCLETLPLTRVDARRRLMRSAGYIRDVLGTELVPAPDPRDVDSLAQLGPGF